MTRTRPPRKCPQLVLEPGHRAQVEVVGGLVEDQQLGRPGQHPGQRHPLGLPAGQGAHVHTGGGGHAQAVEGGLGLPPFPDRPAHRPRGQRGHLLEKADPGTPAPPDLTLVGEVRAGDDSQQRRFPRPVDAHHADTVPVGDGERESLEEDPVGPPHGDVLEIDEHGHEASRVPATGTTGRGSDGRGSGGGARGRGRPWGGVQRGGAGTVMDGASVPPSTCRIFPVTQPEAGEAR